MSLALYWKKGAVWGQISGTVTDQTDLMNYLDANFFKQNGNSFGGTARIGTNDSTSLVFITNGTDRWAIDRTSGYMARGSGTQGFALQLFGTGVSAGMTFGDVLDPTTPYCFVGEYNGLDTDQTVVYGQKGGGIMAGTWGVAIPQVWVTLQGRVGINKFNPTAKLHIAGSQAGSNNAALKFDSGTLSSVEDGAVEYDGTNYYATVGASRAQFARIFTGSAVLNFPSTAAGAVSDLNISVAGASVGDCVAIGVPSGSITTTATFSGFVAAGGGVVTVRYSPKATEDPPSGTFKAIVIKNI